MKYVVIGDADTVLGFRYAGIEGTAAGTSREVVDALERASASPDTGVIIITERAASLAQEAVDAIRASLGTPVLVEIADRHGPLPGKKTLSDLIREAVGIRI